MSLLNLKTSLKCFYLGRDQMLEADTLHLEQKAL